MESRGDPRREKDRGRPPIYRRSCDSCRARKVGCDRKSPCSNCVSAKLDCTHSAVSSGTSVPKRRILLSTQYERKIDSIAQDVADIKHSLSRPHRSPNPARPLTGSMSRYGNQRGAGCAETWVDLNHDIDTVPRGQHVSAKLRPSPSLQHEAATVGVDRPRLHKAAYIIGFVRCVTEFPNPATLSAENEAVVLSLRGISREIEQAKDLLGLPVPDVWRENNQGKMHNLPPQDAAVSILRWARDNEDHPNIAWVFQVVPFETSFEACQRVYFALDGYSAPDLVLASTSLRYMFAAHSLIHGDPDSWYHEQVCQQNTRQAIAQLPLLLPESMSTVAALILGTLAMMECSNLLSAWSLILNASDMCQRLGYHRSEDAELDEKNRQAHDHLFLGLYKLEKALSSQIDRPSTIRDSAITIPLDEHVSRLLRVQRLFDKIDSKMRQPSSLAGFASEQQVLVEVAQELRELSRETLESARKGHGMDPIRCLSLQHELLRQSSLLGLALSSSQEVLLPGAPEAEAARNILDAFCQCMTSASEGSVTLQTSYRYQTFSILNSPFSAFAIVFTQAVQNSESGDLARLQNFANSINSLGISPSIATTHHLDLYLLLCQAARSSVEVQPPVPMTECSTLEDNIPMLLQGMEYPGELDALESASEMEGHYSHIPDMEGWILDEIANFPATDMG